MNSSSADAIESPPAHARIDVVDLVKIFGDSPERALRLLDEGLERDEIRTKTGQLVAVNRVSFSVNVGETFVVMGLSGSGKSTLVRCLNRLLEPTAGQVVVDGENLLTLRPPELRAFRRERISMVFQHFALLPHQTVVDNVEFGLKVQDVPKAERRERAMKALSLVGLEAWAANRPRTLSGGMQQRVGLARALATDPDVLLMDEPFSALDPLIRRDMQDELLDLQQRLRKTIVFITHDIAEALRLGDRIAVMREGQMVQIATPAELVAEPSDEYVANFLRGVDRGKVLRLADILTPASGETSTPPPLRDPRSLMRLPASATLEEAYSVCADESPIAVVDEEGRLVGTVRAGDVLTALAAGQQHSAGLQGGSEAGKRA